jgi:hypothetical protein
MKPYLLILLLFLGCVEKTPAQIKADEDADKSFIQKSFIKNIEIIEYEGHEYVVYAAPYQGGITHKANCKYCENK